MADPHHHWLQKLGALNPNSSQSKGKAPHKPLLLLCIIELARDGLLTGPDLAKSPDLQLRFDSLWSIVQPRWGGRPGLDLPFHHLRTQKFWQTYDAEGRISKSPDTTRSVTIDPGFLVCLSNRNFQHEARVALIRKWFTKEEQTSLLSALGISPAEAKKAEFKVKEMPYRANRYS